MLLTILSVNLKSICYTYQSNQDSQSINRVSIHTYILSDCLHLFIKGNQYALYVNYYASMLIIMYISALIGRFLESFSPRKAHILVSRSQFAIKK